MKYSLMTAILTATLGAAAIRTRDSCTMSRPAGWSRLSVPLLLWLGTAALQPRKVSPLSSSCSFTPDEALESPTDSERRPALTDDPRAAGHGRQ